MTLDDQKHQTCVPILDDELWDRLIEVTNGAAGLCYQCGVCTASCPWGTVRDEPLSVRSFMRLAQLGIHDGNENLWLCTTCGQCEYYCPRGVNICEVFRGLRTLAWENNNPAPGFPSLLWSVFWNGNPWTQPPSQRTDWSKDINLEKFNPAKHEILFYAGCTSSYDQRAQRIAHDLVKLLDAANIRYGYLGEDEPCCGEAVLSTGHKPYFDEIAAETLEIFSNNGVTKILTVSPHCYDVFKNHYPKSSNQGNLIIYHYTQYLMELLNKGRLNFNLNDRTQKADENTTHRVTFQDPCYLGRHNSEYLAPREIIKSLPGVEFVEMEHNSDESLCCGGGGGRMWLETAPGERFADIRIEEARKTGARVLITACPFCVVCLEDSIKSRNDVSMTVMDIAEFAALQL